MSMAVLSLIAFVAVIVLAFFRKNNIGVLAIGIGVIAIRYFGITDKEFYSSISISLFTTLTGITLLFSIITNTGALDLLARKIVALAGKRIWLIPVLVYMAGFTIVAVGPGGVPALAIVPPLAVAIAYEVGYNPLMLALIGISGMTSGRFSPITPESQIIRTAVENAGYTGNVVAPIWVNVILTNLILAVVIFVFFKGYKVKASDNVGNMGSEKFTVKQLVALAAIVALLILIIGFDVNIGCAAYLVAAILLVFHIADDGPCIKAMPWSTIIMVLGVGALLSVVNTMGGIDLISNALSSIMNTSTCAAVMGLSAGALSLVSSALGVVYPTMMPMCIDVAEQLGNIDPAGMMSAVAAAGALSGISPMSTGGALIIAAIAGDKSSNLTKEDENKYFVQLLIIASLSLILLLLVAMIFYNPITSLFAG